MSPTFIEHTSLSFLGRPAPPRSVNLELTGAPAPRTPSGLDGFGAMRLRELMIGQARLACGRTVPFAGADPLPTRTLRVDRRGVLPRECTCRT
jgi:hypothetical protein